MTFSSANVTLVGLFLLSLLVHLCKGTIDCVCTTADCQYEQRPTCEANNLCYVQFMPPGVDTGRLAVIRGCIDERTPLLCENRPPKSYTGSWPVLHCCRENFCNQDVLPTVPSWMAAANENKQPKEEGDVHEPNPNRDLEVEENGKTLDVEATPPEDSKLVHTGRRGRTRTINPLYIGVPVAGACVLLAIIIFAIYVLKRQNQYMEDYRYHSNLRREPNPHKPIVKSLEPQPVKTAFYSECERSSSGSETRLLMKV